MRGGELRWRAVVALAVWVFMPHAWALAFDPEPQELSIARLANEVVISWPLTSQDSILETTTRIEDQESWMPVSSTSTIIQARYQLKELISPNKRFYRGVSASNYVSWIQATDGAVAAEQVGLVLPHEHIFTDLRGPLTPGYGQADAEDVVRVMKPLLEQAKAKGVDTLVETSSVGVGRNVPILARLARETGLRIVVPTGVYGRAQFAPPAYRDMSEDALVAWMIQEIREGIEGTDVKAGFIKVASSETGLTRLEEKFLRSAARAAAETGAAVASHTTSGSVAVREANILQEISSSIRFIWVHAQAEANRSFYRQLAARGVYIEFDSLGAQPSDDARLITAIKELIGAGYGDRVLLSHDAGWYQPGQPNGGNQRPYTYLLETFIPKLKANGLDNNTIQMLTVENPRRAFAVRLRSNHPAVPATIKR